MAQLIGGGAHLIIDGSINWGPDGPRKSANGFDFDARRNSIYEWVRQVRGGILAGAFTVERHLSAAIVFFMLGDRVKIPEVQFAFDEGLLGPLSFERRINVAILLAPKFLTTSEVASLKGDLNELRSLRNAMAHRPFWFHPQLSKEDEVVELVPVITRGKSQLPLTTKLIGESNAMIASLIVRCHRLSRAAAEANGAPPTA